MLFWNNDYSRGLAGHMRPATSAVRPGSAQCCWLCHHSSPGGGGGGGGTPYVMGDTYVPRFWPPFFTLAGSSTIFLGYFFSSTNTKTIFCGIKTTNSYRIRSFRPQISFFPRSFWVQFSAASGTPPSFFGPSTPPPPPPPPPPGLSSVKVR